MPRIADWSTLDAAPSPLTSAGALGGLPYAAKDMFRMPSHRPSGGFGNAADLGITGTSDLLERLAVAGADLIGFTSMTELAYEPSGFNATRGRVRNPWNLDFISGGSSSGSAAAVASGVVIAALGSDTGGSLRIPAHACGVTAWKPTYGLVSARGAMPLAPSLDTIGLLARSAADLMPLVPFMAELALLDVVRHVQSRTDWHARIPTAVAHLVSEPEPWP
jgi:aspartyl-tRNA(Asn)/glutamyl-tRNA(Gln) amidotransferase subunit A